MVNYQHPNLVRVPCQAAGETEAIEPPSATVRVGKLRRLASAIVNLRPIRYLVNWGRGYALWPVHLTVACCSVEFGAAMGPRYDLERFGMMPLGSLRQCDLLLIEGSVTRKMASRVKMIYDQMPDPKYVVAMGACAISGGLFWDSYSVVQGVDKIIPVDVYVPGCPPRPETLADGILELQRKIRSSRV
ncbi:MAG: NADH-quinone oxidoreductase subunit B [Candidatus Hodarchaeota archaeon]